MELDSVASAESARRLRRFREDMERALPGVVREMILFGSRARGDALADSDYDVAVLLAEDWSGDTAIRRLIDDLTWEGVADGYDIQAVPLPARALDPTIDRTELGRRIAEEGVPIR